MIERDEFYEMCKETDPASSLSHHLPVRESSCDFAHSKDLLSLLHLKRKALEKPMLLRLKGYSEFMFNRFYGMLDTTKPSAARTSEDKLILTTFATTGQSVLYFNQSEPDRSFTEWSTDPEIPKNYQLKLNHALTLLIDSARWAVLSRDLDLEIFPEGHLFKLDLTSFRIEEHPDSKDGLTTQFFHTCDLIHRICPHNTRLMESLFRLIESYVVAKDLTAQARDMSHFDRIEYLRHLNRYTR